MILNSTGVSGSHFFLLIILFKNGYLPKKKNTHPFPQLPIIDLISGGNDLDEQVKLQQAMLRRQELLDKIRVSLIILKKMSYNRHVG